MGVTFGFPLVLVVGVPLPPLGQSTLYWVEWWGGECSLAHCWRACGSQSGGRAGGAVGGSLEQQRGCSTASCCCALESQSGDGCSGRWFNFEIFWNFKSSVLQGWSTWARSPRPGRKGSWGRGEGCRCCHCCHPPHRQQCQVSVRSPQEGAWSGASEVLSAPASVSRL